MKIAVIGSGIAGLSCAYSLSRHHSRRVTLFEAESRLGGHTNTVDITVDGIEHAVDTGFLVFNHRTYPTLVRLFEELSVPIAKSEMSFSVSLAGELEWAGTSLASVFAQPANLLRPRFLGMLSDIARFNGAATSAMTTAGEISLGDYLDAHRYGRAFRHWYLLPMAAAIWSCPTRAMLDYPFATFARFCHNHGLLAVRNRPQWYTVAGGAREYVRRMARAIGDIRLSCPIARIERTAAGVLLQIGSAASHPATIERFDQVVLACHSDQALAMLATPSSAECDVLGAVRYQPNTAYLHTDRTLLPRRRRVWAAWNYLGGAPDETSRDATPQPVAVSYLINKLQRLPFRSPVIVTLNPATPPRATHLLRRFEYAHPVFDAPALEAQRRLPEIQGADRLWFAGAWTGYGFHEDGLKSGLSIANELARAVRPALLAA